MKCEYCGASNDSVVVICVNPENPFIHSYGTVRAICNICLADFQMDFAQEIAARIPGLKAILEKP